MPSSNPRANVGNKDVGVATDLPPGATHDVIPFNPYDDPTHPSNWPAWKRHAQLVTLAWIAFLANYSAGCHLVLFHEMSLYFDRSITAVANTVGITILGLGVGALLWNPLSASIGRRPTYLIAWTLVIPFTFWMAFSTGYNSFAAARFFAGFAGSVTQVLPVASITELYKPEWRGTAIAFWSLFLILGPPTAPLVASAVTLKHKWQYTYYVVIIFVGVAWFMVALFCNETLYTPPTQEELRAGKRANVTGAPASTAARPAAARVASNDSSSDEKKEAMGDEDVRSQTSDVDAEAEVYAGLSGRVGMVYSPLHEPKRFLLAALEPIMMAGYVTECLPAIFGAVIFGWSVGLTVLLPQIVAEPPYNFAAVPIGASFMPAVVGSFIGKAYGGIGSDMTVTFFARRNGDGRQPEYRCWNMIPPTLLLLPGMLLYGYGFGNKEAWWVADIFGIGIYYAGLVGVTGAIQTLMSECYLSKGIAAVQLYNLFKCVFSFGVPFYMAEWADLPALAEGDGSAFKRAYLAQGLLSVCGGLILFAFLIVFGKRIRAWQKMPVVLA